MKTWFSFSIYHDKLNEVLNPALSTIHSLQQEGSVTQLIFTRSRERGENLLLLLKYSNNEDQERIKQLLESKITDYLLQHPAPEKEIVFPVNDWFLPFPNNHIEYKNNFIFDIMETGGVQAAVAAENLFCQSSELIGQMISEAESSWDIESSFVNTLQFNLILSSAFNTNAHDLKNFYSYLFESVLKSSTINDDVAAKESLLNEFEENFQAQKEGLVNFINYEIECVYSKESFDEEWINEWIVASNKAEQLITQTQQINKYITPEDYTIDSSINTPTELQEKWPVLVYYMRFINCQIGMLGVYELNLIYTLKRSIETILIDEQINANLK